MIISLINTNIAGNIILRTMTNWTNGYCSGNYDYFGPLDGNLTYANNECNSNGLIHKCVDDPDFESWPGRGSYEPNQYSSSSCSPYYGPNFIFAYPPTCSNISSPVTTKSIKYECASTSLSEIVYITSSVCSSTSPTSTKNYNLDQCIEGSANSYYSCPLTILPGVAFLAIGNDQTGIKVINKVFVGGIFSIVILGTFLVLLSLVLLFYYRRVYRPLKKLIMELANTSDEVTRNSQKAALDNVGAGSFCSWLCGCGKVDTEGIKKLAEE